VDILKSAGKRKNSATSLGTPRKNLDHPKKKEGSIVEAGKEERIYFGPRGGFPFSKAKKKQPDRMGNQRCIVLPREGKKGVNRKGGAFSVRKKV